MKIFPGIDVGALEVDFICLQRIQINRNRVGEQSDHDNRPAAFHQSLSLVDHARGSESQQNDVGSVGRERLDRFLYRDLVCLDRVQAQSFGSFQPEAIQIGAINTPGAASCAATPENRPTVPVPNTTQVESFLIFATRTA